MDQRWVYRKISACPVAADDFGSVAHSVPGLSKAKTSVFACRPLVVQQLEELVGMIPSVLV